MKMDKKTIKDPFLGEIELTKVGETSMHLMGESKVETLYVDSRNNLWIDTWSTVGGGMEDVPMMYLRKEVVNKIIEVFTNE
jgi:hypothetical protein